MTTINPWIKESSMKPKVKKHEENYTKTHPNQIAKKQVRKGKF